MLSHSNTATCFSFVFIFDVRFFSDFLILHREIVQITAKTEHCKLYIECLSNCDIKREIHVLAAITAFVIGSRSIGNTCTKVAEPGVNRTETNDAFYIALSHYFNEFSQYYDFLLLFPLFSFLCFGIKVTTRKIERSNEWLIVENFLEIAWRSRESYEEHSNDDASNWQTFITSRWKLSRKPIGKRYPIT